jgi:coenzyme F420-reducing hydrogenase alpha subunit
MEKVSIPGGWVSEVFAEDVQKLIEEAQELSNMAERLEDNIQNLHKWLIPLSKTQYAIVVLESLIRDKLERYKPNDSFAQSYLYRINIYVNDIMDAIRNLTEEYKNVSSTGIDPYITRRYLQEIKIKARDIISTLRDAIKYNVFVIENPNERVIM